MIKNKRFVMKLLVKKDDNRMKPIKELTDQQLEREIREIERNARDGICVYVWRGYGDYDVESLHGKDALRYMEYKEYMDEYARRGLNK